MESPGIAELLEPSKNWQCLNFQQQLLCSIGAHACICIVLICTVSHNSEKFYDKGQVISLELIRPGEFYTRSLLHSDLNQNSKVIPVIEEEDFTNPNPIFKENLPLPTRQPEHFDRHLQRVLSTSGKGNRESRAYVRSKSSQTAVASAKIQTFSLLPAASQTTGAASVEHKSATNIVSNTDSTARETFSELDMKACRTFVEGENLAEKDLEKAKSLWQEAIKIMDRAIPLLITESGPESATMAEALRNVGRCYDKLKQYDRSAELYSQSAEMLERVKGPEFLGRGISLVYLGDARIEQSNYHEAETALLASLPVYCKHYGENSQYVGWTYQRLARICFHTNRAEKGIEWQKKAQEILKNN